MEMVRGLEGVVVGVGGRGQRAWEAYRIEKEEALAASRAASAEGVA